MATTIIIFLLVGNLVLVALLIANDRSKTDSSTEAFLSKETVMESDEPAPEIVGKSQLDIDEWRKALHAEIKEIVPLIIKEYGTYADAGWESLPDKVVKSENLDMVFSNTTASELSGEAPEPTEPKLDGIDYREVDTTMKVVNGNSTQSEDIVTARRVLSEIKDAQVFERIQLDPVIQKRILMIECHLSDTPEDTNVVDSKIEDTHASQSPAKKIVYHADIETLDVDAINLNIFH